MYQAHSTVETGTGKIPLPDPHHIFGKVKPNEVQVRPMRRQMG
jgi:hypothetical protein